MKRLNILLIVGLVIVSCGSKSEVTPAFFTPDPEPKTYSFSSDPVWAEEFDYSGLPDSEKWGYDIGGHGWGNNELQYYSDDIGNVQVENGVLTITAKKESVEGKECSSARLVSKDKGDFLYGKIEVKAKLPGGRGTWPAIWMLPTDWEYGGWPASGEIDIMEHVGYDMNKVHITVHTEAYNHTTGTQVGKNIILEDVTTAFHLYRVEWTPESINGFVDDVRVFTFRNEENGFQTWPFDKRFHLLLNIAVGGDWGGVQGVDDAVFPVSMEIDYVRVYKLVEE